jgi:hypothetical protein
LSLLGTNFNINERAMFAEQSLYPQISMGRAREQLPPWADHPLFCNRRATCRRVHQNQKPASCRSNSRAGVGFCCGFRKWQPIAKSWFPI